MFRKDFHVKSNIAIRGSDRRKLRSNLAEQLPSLSADEVIPNKDAMTVKKVFTHADYTVMVYCLNGDPVFFEWEKQLYPTVYLLWKYPGILPCLITWPPVLDKMVGGADLMLPGVVVPSFGLPEIAKRQLCAICLPDSGAPVAIGIATMSSADMIASGMKGKGVQTLHCYKDFLWKQGSKSNPPTIPFPNVQSTLSEEDSGANPQTNESSEVKPPTDDIQQLNLNGTSAEPNSTSINEQLIAATGAEGDTAELPAASGESAVEGDGVTETGGATGGTEDVVEDEEVEDDIPPAVKMDRLLYQCLLHSLKCKVKKSDLPLLTSTFYKNHILPCCPRNQTLDVKKSSYKKFSKFLQAMQQEHLLTVKTEKKGIDNVVDIDRSHPDVRAFEIPEGDTNDEDDVQGGKPTNSEAVWSSPEIKEFFQVTTKMLPVLKCAGYRQGAWMTAEEVRKAVTDYVKQEELADRTDRRLVVLDPVLHDAVMKKTEPSTTHLAWDKLFTRSYRELTRGHQLVLGNPGIATENQRMKKGNIEPIELKIQRKAGNKLVTLITRLETFGIDPKDFSHRIQKGVSASSSVSALPGQGQGQQVLVQGNQVNYVDKLLTEHYKLPRKYIRGLELAPKSGKRR
ncbi:eukaryotic translation initiation factor 2D-like [Amphiura filiformis]|uniref:eukaryotic translation initiation factor 2D-like n=1 Tax=Amphiura filiformis TaxID=82378 RepID=UPI003B211FEE